MHRGLEPTDDAWLVIGDQALKMVFSPSQLSRWTHVTDLATEWWDWQQLPFVFAQWVCRKDVDPSLRNRLSKHVQYSFHRSLVALQDIAEKESERLGLHSELVHEYLKGFMYELNGDAIRSMAIFRELVSRTESALVGQR
jgi:chorismate dehydratase